MVQVGNLYFLFDRKQADVDLVNRLNAIGYHNMTDEQKIIWNTDLPGAFNLSDINRIEGNVLVIGTEVGTNPLVKTWEITAKPRASDFERIVQNVGDIKTGYAAYETTPDIPEVPINTYEKVNVIEQILHDVHEIYLGVTSHYDYASDSPEIYCGDEIGVI